MGVSSGGLNVFEDLNILDLIQKYQAEYNRIWISIQASLEAAKHKVYNADEWKEFNMREIL